MPVVAVVFLLALSVMAAYVLIYHYEKIKLWLQPPCEIPPHVSSPRRAATRPALRESGNIQRRLLDDVIEHCDSLLTHGLFLSSLLVPHQPVTGALPSRATQRGTLRRHLPRHVRRRLRMAAAPGDSPRQTFQPSMDRKVSFLPRTEKDFMSQLTFDAVSA